MVFAWEHGEMIYFDTVLIFVNLDRSQPSARDRHLWDGLLP